MTPKKVSGKDGIKKKKRMMTMEIKHEIVDKYERGARVTDLARMYDRRTSTICTILKQKDVIKSVNPSTGVTIISKLRSNINDEMERLLLLWIKEKQMSRDAITDTIICEKAILIYDDLKQKEAAEDGETSTPGESFKASRGWFNNFKKRTGILSVVRHGEVAEEYVDRFATLVASEDYVPQQVFNCDEMGHFWENMPLRTFITPEENELQGHKPMKDQLTLALCANASDDRSSVLERIMLVSQGEKPGLSQSIETVSQLDCTSASGVLMASEGFTGHLTGDTTDSEEKLEAVEECTLEATEAGVNEQEEMEKDLDFQQPDVDKEKGNPTDQGEEENCVQKDNRELLMNEDKNDTENMAQSSEELVIAKVEDFTNEMAIDVDQTDGKMEVDGPEDAGKALANPIKSEKTEPSAMQTHSVLRTELKGHPSIVIPVKVKDEPMDEEYENASAPVRPVGNIKDEPDTAADFNQTPDAIKISAVFSVGGNATPIAPAVVPAKGAAVPTLSLRPLAPANPIGVVCTGCNKVLLKGQTAFQRKGCAKLYCSPQCLCSTSTMMVKMPQKKQCYHCLKEILDQKDVVNASVDMSGTLKEFCSQKCVTALSFKCSVCQKTGMTYTHGVNFMGSIHKLCSDGCFNQFRSSNKLNINSCVNCGGYCYGTDTQCPSLRIDGSVMKFCKQNCLTGFKKKSMKPVSCKICRALRPVAEMVDCLCTDGIRELFCSTSCVTANKVQTVSSSGVPVECNNCKLKLAPQYHLAMSDGTIQNFCSFSCVVSYQESFSKIKPNNQVNTVTSTTNNTSTQKPAASSDSSSSTKTSAPGGPVQTLTKIPCSQCLNSFFHKPELLEFKRKMYAFCSNACVEEFKQINNVMARCEYCKIDKVVKEVKRINKIDRSFCSEGCKLLYKHDLVKRWGKKHCRNCFYCSGSSQTVVTEVFNNVEKEFCGNVCLQQHALLTRKEIKCSMCRQAKMMAETVKWLGEIKHFCSLQCLMFFCSLQGITGPVRPAGKPLATQGTSPVPSPAPQGVVTRTSLIAKEATPVIANVISLSSASNGQPCILGNSVLQGSIPAATVKSSGNSASTQTDGVKASAPAPRILKNKALLCKPFCQNKGTSCKPNVCDMNTQTDGPSVIVLPVPVPVYVPVPMNLYTQYTPKSFGLPLPIPVPLFFPTTLDSAERIVKTIQEIKEKIPDDPLEADLIMMAEMVAEDTEREKHIASSGQSGNLMDDLDLEALSSNLSWEEDSVSSAPIWDQPPEPERPPPSGSATLTHASTAAEEPQMDLEADFPIEGIELFREQTQKETTNALDSGKRKSRKRGRDGFPQKKRGRKSAAAVPAKPALDNFSNLSKLQNEYAVNAWKDWVRWRNAQPNMETPKFGSRTMTIKEDLLKCCTAELSYGLCKFISEVRRPNGENYSPDSIFYLCLGIQQYLFENNRMENIFSDVFYTKFGNEMTSILKGWKPTILPSGYVHSRVEEEYLWDCKQLGAFSPGVLLNTLLYFFTKFFNYKTVEQHRCLSFGHIVRCSRSKGSTKVACLRFYPPKEDMSPDGIPAKKRKEEEDENDTIYEIKENSDNPLRCPVRLYEFYISKCSPSVRQCTTQFYLSPERSCIPSSPMWFSTSSLSDEVLDSMLTRILTVRELHLETDKTPTETESDSDSDF